MPWRSDSHGSTCALLYWKPSRGRCGMCRRRRCRPRPRINNAAARWRRHMRVLLQTTTCNPFFRQPSKQSIDCRFVSISHCREHSSLHENCTCALSSCMHLWWHRESAWMAGRQHHVHRHVVIQRDSVQQHAGAAPPCGLLPLIPACDCQMASQDGVRAALSNDGSISHAPQCTALAEQAASKPAQSLTKLVGVLQLQE